MTTHKARSKLSGIVSLVWQVPQDLSELNRAAMPTWVDQLLSFVHGRVFFGPFLPKEITGGEWIADHGYPNSNATLYTTTTAFESNFVLLEDEVVAAAFAHAAQRFVSRPIEIEAVRLPGTFDEVEAWMPTRPSWAVVSIDRADLHPGIMSPDRINVTGRQGCVPAVPGDWIIRELDASGCYPCAPCVFMKKYAPRSEPGDLNLAALQPQLMTRRQDASGLAPAERSLIEAMRMATRVDAVQLGRMLRKMDADVPLEFAERSDGTRIVGWSGDDEIGGFISIGDVTGLYDIAVGLAHKIKDADFGQALGILRGGQRVRRAGWNGKGMWLSLVETPFFDVHLSVVALGKEANNLLPWIGMRTADANFVPWLASQTDMLATDWEIAE